MTVVGNHYHRLSLAVQVTEQLHHFVSGGSVQRSRWLVGKDQGNSRNYSPSYGAALLF